MKADQQTPLKPEAPWWGTRPHQPVPDLDLAEWNRDMPMPQAISVKGVNVRIHPRLDARYLFGPDPIPRQRTR